MARLPDPSVLKSWLPPFFLWSAGVYLIVTVSLVALGLTQTGGRNVFLIDDTAIHLSVAESLAHHGTWGVVPGQFQSASSSPLWTLLLAAYVLFAGGIRSIGIPIADTTGPLVLNVLAGLWLLRVLSSQQRLWSPSWRAPFDIVAVAALVIAVLFLPALTVLGMEHTLHMALAVSAVILFERRIRDRDLGWPRWTPYVLLGLATLVRFETLFIALGLGVACLADPLFGSTIRQRGSLGRRLSQAVGFGLSAAVPATGFAIFNRMMGQGWLPNSVLAKGQGIAGETGDTFGPNDILNRLTSDPLLGGLTVLIAGLLLASWRRGHRSSFFAIVFLASTSAHVTFARVGWYERYQAYLIALGALVLAYAAVELLSASRLPPYRTWLVSGLVLVSLLLCGTKVSLTLEVPRAVEDTYLQRYQAGRFLARYYDGQPVATGELGYISLFHRGPLTDFFGLGDYEVLEARRAISKDLGKAYWEALAEKRGFKVAAVYPQTLFLDTPDDWILVGEWQMDPPRVTAFDNTFQFWATVPSEVRPLTQHLRQFQATMPPGSTLEIQELAEYRATQLGDS